MIGRLIKWGLIILIGILVYNFFCGTEQERAISENIFNEVRALGNSLKEAVVHEKKRIGEGKYDDLANQLNEVWIDIKSNVSPEMDSTVLNNLEKKKNRIASDLKSYEGRDTLEGRELLREMSQFIERTDSVLRQGK